MKLTGKQVREIRETLLDAYGSVDALRSMVRIELDETLEAIAGGENLRVLIFNLITWAERTGRVDDLIQGAYRDNPGNLALQQLAQAGHRPAPSGPVVAEPGIRAGPVAIDLFLSYSRKDLAAMREVQEALRTAGLSVWTDEGLEPGTQSWKDAISEAVTQAQAMVVLLSPNSSQSRWVKREIGFAQAREKHIFPVLIAGDAATAVPIDLINTQWVDGRQRAGQVVRQELVPAIRELPQFAKTGPLRTPVPPPRPPRRPWLWLGLAAAILVAGVWVIANLGGFQLVRVIPTPSPTAVIQAAAPPAASPTVTATGRQAPEADLSASVPPTKNATVTSTPQPLQTATPTMTPVQPSIKKIAPPRDGILRIEGLAGPGADVEVAVDDSIAGVTTADDAGRWQLDVQIDAPGEYVVGVATAGGRAITFVLVPEPTPTATSPLTATPTAPPTSTSTQTPTRKPTAAAEGAATIEAAASMPAPTSTPASSPAPTVAPATVPTAVASDTLAATKVPRARGTAVDEPSLQNPVGANATNVVPHNSAALKPTSTPLRLTATPTASPVSIRTPTAALTETTVLVGAPVPERGPNWVTLVEPNDGDGGQGNVEFAWKPDAPLALGQVFEIVFWQSGYFKNGHSPAEATTNNRIRIDTGADFFAPGVYKWGIFLGQTGQPGYERLRWLQAERTFVVSGELELPSVPILNAVGTPTLPAAETTRTNPQDGAIYVYVPAGSFIMGSSAEDPWAQADEKPQQIDLYLDAFWIMRTEVTNAQYAQCVEADECSAPTNTRWNDSTYAEYPVTDVDQYQASTYATWTGGRLPTEAEWEKACRGTDGRLYPWGDEPPTGELARFDVTGVDGTTPVGSYPVGASPYGALDMAGNIREWTADWYAADYYANSPPANPPGPATGFGIVVRGGAFYGNLQDVRCAARYWNYPNGVNSSFGFRVVLPPP